MLRAAIGAKTLPPQPAPCLAGSGGLTWKLVAAPSRRGTFPDRQGWWFPHRPRRRSAAAHLS
jgi:hypothetical protein